MTESKSVSFSPKIAFIVGMGRSGTTLLTNMLNSNPEIIACPENEFVIHSYNSFYQKDFNDEKVIDAFIDMFDHNFNRFISIWKPGSELKNEMSANLSISTIHSHKKTCLPDRQVKKMYNG